MTRKNAMPASRLTREDWVRAAWEVLRESGPKKLSIAEIASRLGLTKGSFYWHFEDRDHFRRAMLDHYREVQTDIVMRAMRDVTGPPAARLRALAVFLARHIDPNLEKTIQEWARSDPEVTRVMEEDHERRIEFVVKMLRDAGWPARKARFRGMAFVLLMTGWNLTRPDQRVAEIQKFARQIEDLFSD